MPIIKIHDLGTDEVIEREMTDAEYKLWLETKEAFDLAETERLSKLNAKSALLEKLGITDEEAKLLLS